MKDYIDTHHGWHSSNSKHDQEESQSVSYPMSYAYNDELYVLDYTYDNGTESSQSLGYYRARIRRHWQKQHGERSHLSTLQVGKLNSAKKVSHLLAFSGSLSSEKAGKGYGENSE